MYSFIAEEKADSASPWSVAEMCRTLGVSRQGFYDWESRAPSDRELGDRMLTIEIEAIWICSNQTYGAPRVHFTPEVVFYSDRGTRTIHLREYRKLCTDLENHPVEGRS